MLLLVEINDNMFILHSIIVYSLNNNNIYLEVVVLYKTLGIAKNV